MTDQASAKNLETVHALVRGAIMDGRLAPGETMSQVVMAQELAVSRTPLREALRMLQSEGLVEATFNKRVRVSALTANDLEQLCTVRVTLLIPALLISVPLMQPEDLARLDGYMAEMAHFAAAEDYERWSVPHHGFHRAVTAHVGARFNALLTQLFEHTERYRVIYLGHKPSDRADQDHREILEACQARDATLTATLLAEHFARSAFAIFSRIHPGHDPISLRQVMADVRALSSTALDEPQSA